jgi:hypothetical protein
MKSKLTIFLATLFLSVFSLSGNAQTTIQKGKAQLIEFTNATAKFTVPSGKTWTIHSAFTSYPDDDNTYGISIKSINGIIQADISNEKMGKALFSSNLLANILPLVLPENTSLELIITKRVGEIRSLYDKSAFLNYTETEN